MLGELYGAESKGQVYGHIHAYLHDNKTSTATISTLLLNFNTLIKKHIMKTKYMHARLVSWKLV